MSNWWQSKGHCHYVSAKPLKNLKHTWIGTNLAVMKTLKQQQQADFCSLAENLHVCFYLGRNQNVNSLDVQFMLFVTDLSHKRFNWDYGMDELSHHIFFFYGMQLLIHATFYQFSKEFINTGISTWRDEWYCRILLPGLFFFQTVNNMSTINDGMDAVNIHWFLFDIRQQWRNTIEQPHNRTAGIR